LILTNFFNLECFRIEFDFQLSHSVYPTDWHLDNLKKIFLDQKNLPHPDQLSVGPLLQNYSTVDEARNDLLMLYIYYSDISYTYIYETPSWSVFSLLSNFGGQLGKF
jgi:hypothetical protein